MRREKTTAGHLSLEGKAARRVGCGVEKPLLFPEEGDAVSAGTRVGADDGHYPQAGLFPIQAFLSDVE